MESKSRRPKDMIEGPRESDSPPLYVAFPGLSRLLLHLFTVIGNQNYQSRCYCTGCRHAPWPTAVPRENGKLPMQETRKPPGWPGNCAWKKEESGKELAFFWPCVCTFIMIAKCPLDGPLGCRLFSSFGYGESDA